MVVGDRNSPILGMNYFPFREDYLVNSSIISAGDSNFIYSNYSQNKYRMEYEGDYYYTENPKYYYLLSGYIFTGEYENTINSLWKPQIDDDSLWKTEGNSWGRTPIMSDHGTLYEEPSMIGPWSGAYEGELTGYEEDDKPSENKISYKQESNGETINYYNVDFLEVL